MWNWSFIQISFGGKFFIEVAYKAKAVSKLKSWNWENRERVCTYGFYFLRVNGTTDKEIKWYTLSFWWSIKSGDYN